MKIEQDKRPEGCNKLISYRNSCGGGELPSVTESAISQFGEAAKKACFKESSDSSDQKRYEFKVVAGKFCPNADTCEDSSKVSCVDIQTEATQGRCKSSSEHGDHYAKLVKAAASGANTSIAQSSTRSDSEDFNKKYTNLGENRSSMCTSQDNSGLGMIGKTLSNVAQTWVDMQGGTMANP